MDRSLKYNISVHFPESPDGVLELRKRAGKTYILFIQNHILGMAISDLEKNKRYESIMEQLIRKFNTR